MEVEGEICGMLLCSQCMTETLKDICVEAYQHQERRFIRAVKKKDLLEVGFISMLCVPNTVIIQICLKYLAF